MSQKILTGSEISKIRYDLGEFSRRMKVFADVGAYKGISADFDTLLKSLPLIDQLVLEVSTIGSVIKSQERIISDLLSVNAFQRDLLSKRPATYLQKMRGE